MTLGEEEITTLWRIRNTVYQMLRDRGYLIDESELHISKDQFISMNGPNMRREDLTIQKSKKNDLPDKIYVFFPEEAKIGVKTMKTYINRMKTENVFRAILVLQQNFTPFARILIADMSSEFQFEVFQEAELLVNIKEHVLGSTHEVLNDEEKNTLLEKRERNTGREILIPNVRQDVNE
ncbi:unnamed protein product [Linum tenue]|uniref:RNA polymerase Rpb5 N-terminal domain-containing protein n=1 Tax=Linum tenue TaxID=586396 RepID=A0AAV0HXR4_9ROSI|nr:unnamed protein product [Linum tenue]